MKQTIATALLGTALATAAAGCQRDRNDVESRTDRHPAPEGRLKVDESAVLPVDVKVGVEREYPGSAVQHVEKRTYDDRVVRYEVRLQTKDGRQVTRLFDANGKPSAASGTTGSSGTR
jgi:hypothetical protein